MASRPARPVSLSDGTWKAVQDPEGRAEASLDFAYFSVDEDRIADLHSILTFVGGRVVHVSAEHAALDTKLPDLAPSWSPVKHYTSWRGRALTP